MSTLDRILARMSDSPAIVEKTASDASAAPRDVATSDPSERMLATVRELSKSASAPAPSAAPVPALDKMAADMAAAEAEAMRKQAELSGAAMCDGFMARLAAYDRAVGTKTASADDSFRAGYAQGREDLEKEASEAFNQGQEAALQEIHKIASEIHYAGQQSARNVLEALARQGQ